ncbi:hypothetical protein [Sorangium sp. So ce117]|uniref:hypothetical protein n=1 Tax=Sorangium sp. So ce117 TaxID=3133277 RepID=UPI003F5E4C63
MEIRADQQEDDVGFIAPRTELDLSFGAGIEPALTPCTDDTSRFQGGEVVLEAPRESVVRRGKGHEELDGG